MEEAKAKQGLEQLKSEGIEHRITDVSIAQKGQLAVAKTRHAAIAAELNSVKKVLEIMQGDCISMVRERNIAIRRAEEAVSLTKDVEKAVKVLTLELKTARECLASVRSAHLQAEEHRTILTLASAQDAIICEEELKQADEETQRLKERSLVAEDLKSELHTASNMLLNLQSELTAYMIAKLHEDSGSTWEGDLKDGTDESKKTHTSIQAPSYPIKELEEVKIHTEEAEDKAICLKVTATSLEAELENEKATLASMKQREGMTFVVVSSLQAELDRTKSEITLAESKENEARQQMVQLPRALQRAAQEADEAKSVAHSAREELRKLKEEAGHAKISAGTIKGRLNAVLKEVEARKASESLALAAVKAMRGTEQTASTDDSAGGVDLPQEEYYALGNRARDADESARERVAIALSQIEVAEQSGSRTLKKLQAMNSELAKRKEAVRVATNKAEKAEASKLATEQELTMRRSELEQRRKEDDVDPAAPNTPKNLLAKDFEQEPAAAALVRSANASKMSMQENNAENAVSGSAARKKKSLFPHLGTLFARKKAQPSN